MLKLLHFSVNAVLYLAILVMYIIDNSIWLKRYIWSNKSFKTTKAFVKVAQIFELPSASSSSEDNKNLKFEFSLSLVKDYLH